MEVTEVFEEDYKITVFTQTADIYDTPCPSRTLLNFEVIGQGEERRMKLKDSDLIKAIKLQCEGKTFMMPIVHDI